VRATGAARHRGDPQAPRMRLLAGFVNERNAPPPEWQTVRGYQYRCCRDLENRLVVALKASSARRYCESFQIDVVEPLARTKGGER